MNPEEFKKVARAVSLSLDSPESVKKQGIRLVAVRDRLKQYHQQIVAVEQSKKQPPFPVAELEDDPRLFKRLMAIQQRSNEILDDAKWLRLIIESLAIDCNKLISKAKKYLQDPEGVAGSPQKKQQPSQPTRSQTRSQPPTPRATPTRPTAPKPQKQLNQQKRTNPTRSQSSQSPQATELQFPQGLDIIGKAAYWAFPPSQGKNKWWVLLGALCLWFVITPYWIWRTNWNRKIKLSATAGVLVLFLIAWFSTPSETTVSRSNSTATPTTPTVSPSTPVQTSPSQSTEELLQFIDSNWGENYPIENYRTLLKTLSQSCKMTPREVGDLATAGTNFLRKEGMQYSTHEMMRQMFLFYDGLTEEVSCKDGVFMIGTLELGEHLEDKK